MLTPRALYVWHMYCAAPQHNGTWGQVVSYDRVAGRYEVKIGGNKHLKLKVANVLPG